MKNSVSWIQPTIVLAAVIVFVFWPCLFAGFLNWDDGAHFFENPLLPLRSLAGAAAIFTAPDSANRTFIPLTILSFGIEQALFGLHPLVSHLINIILHILVAVLVRALALRMGLSNRGAFVAALVFALHPMRVESVAWVTERKDVLFGVFYLWALVLYWDYIKSGRGKLYLGALCCAGAGILAKPMALSLPLVLFLMDWMAGRRWTPGAVLDKLPFFIGLWPVAAVTAILNAHPVHWDLSKNFLVLAHTAAFYVTSFFFPAGLSTVYPIAYPVTLARPEYFVPVFVLAVVGAAVWLLRRNRWVVFACLFYVLSMFFIWRVDLFEGSRGLVNDRFMYIPCVGFVLFLGHVFDECFFKAGKPERAGWPVAIALCVLLGGMAFNRCFIWNDSLAFWNDVLRRDPGNVIGLVNRAECLLADQEIVRRYQMPRSVRYGIVLRDLHKVLEHHPQDHDAWQNLGVALQRLGDRQGSDAALANAVKFGYMSR